MSVVVYVYTSEDVQLGTGAGALFIKNALSIMLMEEKNFVPIYIVFIFFTYFFTTIPNNNINNKMV